MNDLTITVSGWVATDPRHVVGPTGTSLTSFRVASTSRYFDRATNAWADGATEWFTVRVFRGAAVTVMNSIEKGQPVVVTGRLKTNTWQAEAGERTDLMIDATSLGHDLTRGVAKFTRATGDASLGVDDQQPEPEADAESSAGADTDDTEGGLVASDAASPDEALVPAS